MDLLYSLADALSRFMESMPSFPLVFVYIALAAIPVLLLHELGHAWAAQRLLGGDVRVSVGGTAKLAEVRLGRITASIHAVARPGRVSGITWVDASRATARDVLRIALAGPLASLVGLSVSLVLFAAASPTGGLHDLLWTSVGESAFGVLNLIPLRLQERRGGPTIRTDGRLALDAFRVQRALR